jgi:hypothetical protein
VTEEFVLRRRPFTITIYDEIGFETLCKDICPRCKNDRSLQWDDKYKQWIHCWTESVAEIGVKPMTRSAICFATHLRVKYGQA